jgi:hypothetical protein
MTWLIVVALLFMGVPIAEAIATRIKKSGPIDQKEVDKALKQAEQRLASNETRLSALEERVDFYEKLLEAPKNAGPQGSKGARELGS